MRTNHKILPMPATLGYGRISVPGEQSDYEMVSEVHEQQCALLENNEQAAKRRAYENEYWRQRTLARHFQSQAYAQPRHELEAMTSADLPLEEMDPKQRVGELLNIFMDEYNSLKPSRLFFDWVSSMSPSTQINLIRKVMKNKQHRGAVKPSWVRAFNRGIRYMNSGERNSYQIHIKNGLLYQNGTEFDTSRMKTRSSGAGVAIFIQSIEGTFYSCSHLGGQWQQPGASTDGQCRSAGEWKVEQGRITWITGKSSFYESTTDQLVNALSDLKIRNALNQTTDVGVLAMTDHAAHSSKD